MHTHFCWRRMTFQKQSRNTLEYQLITNNQHWIQLCHKKITLRWCCSIYFKHEIQNKRIQLILHNVRNVNVFQNINISNSDKSNLNSVLNECSNWKNSVEKSRETKNLQWEDWGRLFVTAIWRRQICVISDFSRNNNILAWNWMAY